MILADFFRLQAPWERWMDGGSSDGLFLFLQGFGAFFALFFTHAKKRRPAGRPRLLTNSFREVWRARRPSKVDSYRPAFPGRSIVAAGAGRAHRSFRSLANIGVLRAGRAQPLYLLTPAGRFALRATAHRADASLRCASGRFGPSAQQPTGLTLPCAPCGRSQRLGRPPFAAKTAHATASGGWGWDPPVSERRPSPYRAQRGRPLTAAERANQHRANQHERSTKTPCSN